MEKKSDLIEHLSLQYDRSELVFFKVRFKPNNQIPLNFPLSFSFFSERIRGSISIEIFFFEQSTNDF